MDVFNYYSNEGDMYDEAAIYKANTNEDEAREA